MRTTTLSAVVATAVLTLSLAPVGADDDPDEAQPLGDPCGAPAEHPGGDWPSHSRDLDNSRHQVLEDTIGPDEVGDLQAAWVFDASEHEGGVYNNTPVVADGCLYLADSSGTLHALNADSGEVVWTVELDLPSSGYGGGVVGTPAVDEDRLIVIVNRARTPYLAGVDRRDGTVLWETPLGEGDTLTTNASVTIYDGMAFIGFSGNPGAVDVGERGGYVIVDSESGELLLTHYNIPDEDYEAGYSGASIWSTAAVDVETGYAYVGTGNPHDEQLHHEITNSLLKIDLNRDRETFGETVAFYQGHREGYVGDLSGNPACEVYPGVYYYPGATFSATCGQLDLDFGDSPSLFRNSDGDLVLGALQKSGVYHAVYADTMEGAWSTAVGVPCFACNGASAAHDGERALVAAGPPGQVAGLDKDTCLGWLMPLGSPLHYQPVSVANGLMYVVNTPGYLMVYDTETGVLAHRIRLQDDTGTGMVNATSSSGIAIARNTVYVASGRFVISYHLPD
jgi:outer membrane protein assembly factor BamB